MLKYIIFEIVSAIVGLLALLFVVRYFWIKGHFHKVLKQRWLYIPILLFVLAFLAGMLANKTYPPDFAVPAFMHSHAPGGVNPAIPFGKIVEFFKYENRFEKVDDISGNPNLVPVSTQESNEHGIVEIELTAKEVLAEIAPGVTFNYWTYNGQVPGPMLRIKEGNTVELTLHNDPTSLHHHSIDLHAVTGPGGGASVTHVAPGESKSFTWKALNPGLYIYHCAMPNVSTHNSHGQYGLILVEPKDGLPKVDKEFYIVQGELYTIGETGKMGLVAFDPKALLDGIPNYVVFNGKVEDTPRMEAEVGDTVRIYIGNGGVNLISAFHIIGEIFDTVYPEGNIGGSFEKNVQTTAVLPGGASIVEFKLDVPGNYLLVDHALARMNKGAWAVLEVTGKENKEIFFANDQHKH